MTKRSLRQLFKLTVLTSATLFDMSTRANLQERKDDRKDDQQERKNDRHDDDDQPRSHGQLRQRSGRLPTIGRPVLRAMNRAARPIGPGVVR